ncbi:MAG: type III-B CRISPR module RAMP protein Cmr4 [bacterium]
MFEKACLLLYYNETPLHMGTGTAISYVDLPIEREKHTGYPVMPASGIKGVLRDLARRRWGKDKVEAIFGPEEKPEEYSSCLTFTDGRILLLPVRSLRGIFAWVTSPFVLQRLRKDAEIAGLKEEFRFLEEELHIKDDEALVCLENEITMNDKILLEDFEFEAKAGEKAKKIADGLLSFINVFPSEVVKSLLSNLPKKLAITSDDAFSELTNVAMDISTRIKIDYEKGTVVEGALFTEEAVPSESIFYNLVLFTSPYKKDIVKGSEDVVKEIEGLLKECPIVQFGGDATVGRGLVRVAMYRKEG